MKKFIKKGLFLGLIFSACNKNSSTSNMLKKNVDILNENNEEKKEKSLNSNEEIYKVVRKDKKHFNGIIKNIAEELNLDYKIISEWLIVLNDNKSKKTIRLLNKRFQINSTVADRICDDKAFTYDILFEYNVPAILHKIFLDPRRKDWVKDEDGVFGPLIEYCKQFDMNVVIKTRSGHSGIKVFHCINKREIEDAALQIFQKDYGLTLSPFYDIVAEYRLVYLDGECIFMYKKEKPFILGDGKSNLFELLISYMQNQKNDENKLVRLKNLINDSIDDTLNWESIPEKNKKIIIGWKHNLALNAPISLNINENIKEKLIDIGKNAVKALDIRFACVDISEIENDKIENNLKIMEINSGVTLEGIIGLLDNGYEITKEVYKKAILKMFETHINYFKY